MNVCPYPADHSASGTPIGRMTRSRSRVRASGCGPPLTAAVTQYVSMAMPGLLYRSRTPGSDTAGVRSRAMLNGSLGTGRRFQKSPFHPVSRSCERPSASASSSPDVWEPRWRTVTRDFRGSAFHCGTYLAAGSSSATAPSVSATPSDIPPTRALASDAV